MDQNLPPPVSDSDALFAFKCMAARQPGAIMDMLSVMAEDDDLVRALDAFEGVAEELVPALEHPRGRIAQTWASFCSACGYEGAQALGRLHRAAPFIWADHSLCSKVFEAIADSASSWSNDDSSDFAKECSAAASSWLPRGLAPAAWEALARCGGPAWRAFKADHGADARKDILSHPDAEVLASLDYKPAARLAKVLGRCEYGLHGRWHPSDSWSASARLSAAFGLRQLERDLSRAVEGSDAGAALDGATAMVEAIAACVRASSPRHEWTPLALSALRRLESQRPALAAMGIELSELEASIDGSLGFEGLGAWSSLRRHSFRRDVDQGERTRKITLPDLLLLSQDGALRREGLRLGADPDAFFETWRPEITQALTKLGANKEAALALAEARHLAAHADHARMESEGSPAIASSRPTRI